MTVSIQSQSLSVPSSTTHPTAKGEIENLVGVLWYEMLSSLNQTGLSEDTLGTGGSNFQSMFLWNVAENDFGKYDTSLIKAALHQIGGVSNQIQGSVPEQSMTTTLLANKGVTNAVVFEESLPSPDNDESFSSGEDGALSPDLTTQATNFTKAIWPQIIAASKILGVPAVAVLAQTALETGWGAAAPGHNLFGIKAVDGQDGSARATHEVLDGVLTAQVANFRNYPSAAASISDYVSLIQTLYPDAVNQNSVAGFAQALQTGGYATDQNYAGKIEQIAQSPLMLQVLQAVEATQPARTGDMP